MMAADKGKIRLEEKLISAGTWNLKFAVALLCMSLAPALSFGALDRFLKIEGIEGESTDASHPNEIDVLAWSWGVSAPIVEGTVGGTRASGKAKVEDLVVTKYIDKSSPRLINACLDGQRLPSVVLTVRRAGDSPQEFYRIELKDVIVSSHSTLDDGVEGLIVEQVSFNFGEIIIRYTIWDATGASAGNVETEWLVEEGKGG